MLVPAPEPLTVFAVHVSGTFPFSITPLHLQMDSPSVHLLSTMSTGRGLSPPVHSSFCQGNSLHLVLSSLWFCFINFCLSSITQLFPIFCKKTCSMFFFKIEFLGLFTAPFSYWPIFLLPSSSKFLGIVVLNSLPLLPHLPFSFYLQFGFSLNLL